MLPGQLAGQYLDAAIQVIEAENAGIPVKISAVKAVHKLVSAHLYDWTLTNEPLQLASVREQTMARSCHLCRG